MRRSLLEIGGSEFEVVWKNDQMSDLETERIRELARGALSVPGDFVEFGCYKGDTSLLLAEVIGLDSGLPRKRLWLYDSFEGLPGKGEFDEVAAGEGADENARFVQGELASSAREVKERFLRAGLKVPRIVKGWFSEVSPEDLPEVVAFGLIDGDLYESTRDAIFKVSSRVSPGGVLVFHDYANPVLPGVKKAVEEWLSGLPVRPETEVFESMLVVRL